MADKANTNPSSTILERIFGRTPSDPEFDRRMELAKAKMQQEMPNEMNSTSIQPAGIIGGMMNKLAGKVIGAAPVATTGRFGGISYDPEQMKQMSQNEIEDTLAHELTHVGQINRMPIMQRITSAFLPQPDEGLPNETARALREQGWDPSYRGKASEMEAYGAEQQRQLNTQRGFPGYDIDLRSKVNTAPSSKVLAKVK